ncbi:hypothetical protein H5410_006220 [Solanum commersonii]|uniref:Uncharacterized protein n=1 Tax=Solanum commersonii TaxID=4109 RepID=A0A9J6A9S8_SOLCO|nr:hypothetical protein H5410_006220 [Solanum commersonii]
MIHQLHAVSYSSFFQVCFDQHMEKEDCGSQSPARHLFQFQHRDYSCPHHQIHHLTYLVGLLLDYDPPR